MRWLKSAAAALGTVIFVGAASPDYLSIKRKFNQIEKGQVRPGSQVTIPERELNAYVKTDVIAAAPPGFREPSVNLENGRASGTALIDFLKIREASGAPPPNWLMRQLLSGERPVSVTARVDSGGGQATVNVERVEIDGIPITGAALDYLINNYLLPRYPDAKIGKPFEIGHRIDRFDIRPNEVRVIIAR